jgi:CBS domain containing-hemolysin-like protein
VSSFQTIFYLLIGVLLLDLVLTASKTAFTNARFPRLLALRDQNRIHAEETVKLLERRLQLGNRLQISHVITRFLIAGLFAITFLPWPDTILFAIEFGGILVVSAIVLSFLELIAETRVLKNPEVWAVRLTGFTRIFLLLLRLTGFTRIFLLLLSPVLAPPILLSRLLASEPDRYFRVTGDELKLLLEASQEEGVLKVDERKMISSIFQFRDTLAREIMVPRIDFLALNVDTPIQDAVDAMLESGYSRVPVYEETIDEILGVLYVKDLLRLFRDGELQGALQDRLRPAYFVPETKKADELLTEMQDRRTHIAIVVDEYGGVAGLVTLEDIVEELVGEIQDEYDQAEELIYQEVEEGEYVFQARIDLDDFNEIMSSEVPDEEAETLGGLIYSRVGRVPKSGETVRVDDILLTVEHVVGRRIRKVRAQRTPNYTGTNEAKSYANG